MATMREIASWSLCTKCTKNELFNEKKEFVMYYAKEIDGHGFCVFDAETGIVVREDLTWDEVMEFAAKMICRAERYDRENDGVRVY